MCWGPAGSSTVLTLLRWGRAGRFGLVLVKPLGRGRRVGSPGLGRWTTVHSRGAPSLVLRSRGCDRGAGGRMVFRLGLGKVAGPRFRRSRPGRGVRTVRRTLLGSECPVRKWTGRECPGRTQAGCLGRSWTGRGWLDRIPLGRRWPGPVRRGSGGPSSKRRGCLAAPGPLRIRRRRRCREGSNPMGSERRELTSLGGGSPDKTLAGTGCLGRKQAGRECPVRRGDGRLRPRPSDSRWPGPSRPGCRSSLTGSARPGRTPAGTECRGRTRLVVVRQALDRPGDAPVISTERLAERNLRTSLSGRS